MRAKMLICVFSFVFTVAVGIFSISHADLTAVGPVNVSTDFPNWFRDIPGMRLAPCNVINEDPQNRGFNLPPCSDLILFDFGGGFAVDNIQDVIYYRAQADILPPSPIAGSRVRLDVRGEGPNETVFNEIEVRLRTLPQQGIYRIVTPFGSFDVNVTNTTETIVVLPGAAQGALIDNFELALPGNVQFFLPNSTAFTDINGKFLGDGGTPAPLIPGAFVPPPGGALHFRVIGPQGSDVDETQPNFTVEAKVDTSAPDITVNPLNAIGGGLSGYHFGTINVDSVIIKDFTVQNIGVVNVLMGTATISGPQPDVTTYTKSIDTCSGKTVLPDGACTIQIRFLPILGGFLQMHGILTIPSNELDSPHVINLLGVGTHGQVFSDVLGTSPFENHINSLFNNSISTGCTPGNFCPQSPVTRGQMSAFIIRAVEGEPLTGPPTPTFTDVPLTHIFFKHVERMAALGITLGIGGGLYGPDLSVTRAEMASFIVRAKDGADAPGPCTGFFIDVPVGAPHCANIEKLRTYTPPVTLGCTATEYCPGNTVPREQMAAFIARAFLGLP